MSSGRFAMDRFRRLPVVGILRGFAAEPMLRALHAACRGGLTSVEITMDTPAAEQRIREAIAAVGGEMNVGAGTVTSVERLESALRAGATFVVTPTLVTGVIERCVAKGIPVFPGALSPTEIQRATEMGATAVKVFPADGLGADYVRCVKESLPSVALMPTGGVEAVTVGLWVEAGADALGVGGPLFRRDRVEAEDWDWIETQARVFRQAYDTARSRRP